ncbi:MAG: glycosyltransferase [Patescibacteria group bacterium]
MVQLGGAERVLIELHKTFPDAPIYTLFTNQEFTKNHLPEAKVRTSYLQKIPGITKIYPYLAMLMPIAIESFDLSDFDIVISSSPFFAKGVVTRPRTKHICYCYSPSRQLWDNAKNQKGIFKKIGQHFLRIWDRHSADRVDTFVAISKTAQERIKKYYGRESQVIYPPFTLQLAESQLSPVKEPYYLIVSRLYPNKNIHVAIEAFNKLDYPLFIIGEGPMRAELEKQAKQNIRFLGFQPDSAVVTWYKHAKAFIMPQEEDFGLTAVESLASGTPVLALRKGGAMEIVQEGITGELFNDPRPEVLAEGVFRLNKNLENYDKAAMLATAEKFSRERFNKEIKNII